MSFEENIKNLSREDLEEVALGMADPLARVIEDAAMRSQSGDVLPMWEQPSPYIRSIMKLLG